jgi:hypothetical protein
VKSAGWEKRTTHFPFMSELKFIGPSVVIAEKSGAGSPMIGREKVSGYSVVSGVIVTPAYFPMTS